LNAKSLVSWRKTAFATLRSKSTKTANGIDVISVGPAGIAAGVTVYVRGGSTVETHEMAGATHHMKWLAYQGNQKRPAVRSQRELAVLGASLSVQNGREAIQYQSIFQKKDLGHVVEILSGFVQPRLEEYEVRDSIGNLHNDSQRINRNKYHQLVDAVHAGAFGFRGLGADEHSRQDAELSVDQLRRWVAQTYHGKNIVVVGVGVEHSELEEAVSQSFVDVPAGTEAHHGAFKLPAVPGWPEASTHPFPVQLPQSGATMVAIGWRGPSRGHSDFAKLNVLAQVLGHSSDRKKEYGYFPGSGVTGLLAPTEDAFSSAHSFHFSHGQGSVFGAFIRDRRPRPASSYVPLLTKIFKALATEKDEVLQKAILLHRREMVEYLDTVGGQLAFFNSQVVLPAVQTPQAYLAELEALKPEHLREAAPRFAKTAPSSLVGLGNVVGSLTAALQQKM